MISTSDRREAIKLVDEACRAGARRTKACAELGISVRTYQRWSRGGEVRADGRPTAKRPPPRNKLSEDERTRILQCCHDSEFASLPPTQIVPILADRGVFLASESTMYRVLNEHQEQHHRGRSKAPRSSGAPARHCAYGACEVWSWDITWLAGPVRGLFYYLYLIVDLYSRKIVGWEVHEREAAQLASDLVRRAVLREGCVDGPLVLHADNGSPQKGSALRATLESLGVTPSYSRPGVSDDNAFSEALFRTFKYRPGFPCEGFESLEAARAWVARFVSWYNHEHRHSGIKYVTPEQRHRGLDHKVLAERKAVYDKAKSRHPERWSGQVRNWEPQGEVWLNPPAPVNTACDPLSKAA